ncbi:hypothetical protein EDB84DRAFT_1559769 [Lactarius hengduanensis]|nr:hypothetical protein EDB84DRAFT_1559769 [Lactarius hengduanensis]
MFCGVTDLTSPVLHLRPSQYGATDGSYSSEDAIITTPKEDGRVGITLLPGVRTLIDSHRSPDEDGVVEEDVRRMEMETDALRCAAHHSRGPLPSSDTLLPLAPRETLKIEQNRAMCGEGSRTPISRAEDRFEGNEE